MSYKMSTLHTIAQLELNNRAECFFFDTFSSNETNRKSNAEYMKHRFSKIVNYERGAQ